MKNKIKYVVWYLPKNEPREWAEVIGMETDDQAAAEHAAAVARLKGVKGVRVAECCIDSPPNFAAAIR